MNDGKSVELTPNHPAMWKMMARAHHGEACILLQHQDQNLKLIYERLKIAEASERAKVMFGDTFVFGSSSPVEGTYFSGSLSRSRSRGSGSAGMATAEPQDSGRRTDTIC
jgi:hypothetical protein